MNGCPHTTRRLNLAEWHAREAILCDANGNREAAAGHIGDALEYLTVILGRAVDCETADDAIALCCQIQDGALTPCELPAARIVSELAKVL